LRAATPNALQRALYHLIGYLWFDKVSIEHPERLRVFGPALFLGLHRNGALDGLAYFRAVPGAAYLVSAQLHRSVLGRFLFPGIAIARRKDRERGIHTANDSAIDQCLEHLAGNGQLFVMPEGTSTLGPSHLPFKPGAARIAFGHLRGGKRLTLVPLAIHYECAWRWQRRVHIVVGETQALSPAMGVSQEQMATLICACLEKTGVNFSSHDSQRRAEQLSFLGSLATNRNYAQNLAHFERDLPPALSEQLSIVEAQARLSGAWTYQRLPLVPKGSVFPTLMMWLPLAVLMAGFSIPNLPPLFAGYYAGRKLPDDINVVAIWSATIGLGTAFLFTSALTVGLLLTGHWVALLTYFAVSWAGVRAFDFFRRLTVVTYNGLIARRGRGLRESMACLGTRLAEHFRHA
jgi:hypothetical protein